MRTKPVYAQGEYQPNLSGRFCVVNLGQGFTNRNRGFDCGGTDNGGDRSGLFTAFLKAKIPNEIRNLLFSLGAAQA